MSCDNPKILTEKVALKHPHVLLILMNTYHYESLCMCMNTGTSGTPATPLNQHEPSVSTASVRPERDVHTVMVMF